MKRCVGFCFFLAALLPSFTAAADFGVNGTTLVRMEKQSYPGFAKKTLLPATQFLGIDSSGLYDGNLSLHLYGWKRADLADNSSEKGSTDSAFSYGYLRYRFPKANGEVKAGRFFQSDAGMITQLDGVSARTDLPPAGLALSMFAGRPVPTDNGNSGDYLAGSRLSQRLAGVLEIGASMLREGGLNNNGPTTYRQIMGVDLWHRRGPSLELNGRSFYDTATSGFTEHLYSLSYKPHKTITLATDFQRTPLEHFFAATNLSRTPFVTNRRETFSSCGASATIALPTTAEVVIDYRHFKRDSRNASDRYGFDIRIPREPYLSGFGYHRTGAGNLKTGSETDFSSYHELRGYTLYRKGKIDGSLDVIAQLFDDAIFGKDHGYELQASCGYHLMPELKFSVDLSIGDNPLVENEFKGLARVTFAFDKLIIKGVDK
ncbi:MAG: hypothetical protein HGB32_00170 [Geobacteraceae bacterium]|nr:hypothetical protein [Geobacteraceae bacterium]